MVLEKLNNLVQKKKMKLHHYLTPYTQINSKWTKDLSVRPKTTKLRSKHKENYYDITFGNDFLGMIFLKVTSYNNKQTNKLTYIKIYNFYTSKDTIDRMKRQPQNWKKYLQIIYLKGV